MLRMSSEAAGVRRGSQKGLHWFHPCMMSWPEWNLI